MPDSLESPAAMDSTSEENLEALVTQDAEEGVPALPFPVVALGASAGGLEAFTRILQHLPADTGMTLVSYKMSLKRALDSHTR